MLTCLHAPRQRLREKAPGKAGYAQCSRYGAPCARQAEGMAAGAMRTVYAACGHSLKALNARRRMFSSYFRHRYRRHSRVEPSVPRSHGTARQKSMHFGNVVVTTRVL